MNQARYDLFIARKQCSCKQCAIQFPTNKEYYGIVRTIFYLNTQVWCHLVRIFYDYKKSVVFYHLGIRLFAGHTFEVSHSTEPGV